MAGNKFTITVGGESGQVGTASELVVALDVLQGHHDRAILTQLEPHLPEIIRDSRGLYLVLKALAPDDHLYFLDRLGPRVGGLLDRSSGLRDILAMLAETEVEAKLIALAGAERLRELVESPSDLAGLLEWLYGEGDRQLLEALGDDFLRDLFQSGAELSLVLTALARDGQDRLLRIMGAERITGLTRDGLDLRLLLRALPPNLSLNYLRGFTPERLRWLIRNEHGWQELRRVLEPEEEDFLRPLWEGQDAK